MALSIKDEETDRLVRRYARSKGVSYTAAIKLAVSEAMHRDQGAKAEGFTERLRRAQTLAAGEPRNSRTAEEILGYDDRGLPR